ncbi:MAG: 50S ribosomal protein L11 methyltransferase [Gammaproteobacteria bacterium]|nr:50S ribosomal protein L11 methyltransferase [Gammaproteobacteria bacterium]
MSTDWPEVVVPAVADSAEQLESWLFTAGALSVTYRDEQDEPILEPEPGEVRLWDRLIIKALFKQGQSSEAIDTALKVSAASMNLDLPVYHHSGLEDTVWERTWMADFKPMQFGASLWICPRHLEPVDAEAHTIMLDPGLAFGTGTHATTAQCLRWLGDLKGQSPLAGRSVLDFGCGSGVLAIAAALLGAEKIWAVDIDPQALMATEANAAANGVGSRVLVGPAESLGGLKVDLILANILFEPLMNLEQAFANYIYPGGEIVLSGVLEEQISALCMRYNEHFVFDESQVEDNWALLVATRRSTS